MDAGSSLNRMAASIMTQWHHFHSPSDPEFPNLSQFEKYHGVKLLPYAYGKHINVLKHFVYV